MRDSQRSKVYSAEDKALKMHGRPAMTIQECQALVDKMYATAWMRKEFGNVRKPIVTPGRNGGRAMQSFLFGPEINLGLAARNEPYIIHEVAHHLAGFNSGHGWKFCHVYLKLVRRFMGVAAHDALKASFKESKVKFTPPRPKRTISDEQKAVLVARLAAARAAKASNAKEAA